MYKNKYNKNNWRCSRYKIHTYYTYIEQFNLNLSSSPQELNLFSTKNP